MTLAVLLTGCGGPSFPPETDATRGRELLKTVLEKWKSGGSADELKNGTPSIIANDPDWKAGSKLKGYEISTDDRRSGVDLLISVKLQLTKPDGQSQDKKVNFAIGINGTSQVVLRSE
jgi:hypothetical protein